MARTPETRLNGQSHVSLRHAKGRARVMLLDDNLLERHRIAQGLLVPAHDRNIKVGGEASDRVDVAKGSVVVVVDHRVLRKLVGDVVESGLSAGDRRSAWSCR